MANRIQDLLVDRAAAGFVGRTEEIALLLGALEPGQPPVWYLHGLAGVGKSRILDVVVDRARGIGAVALRIDCRTVEPTARSFLAELGEHVGAAPGPVAEMADRIGDLGDRVLLVLDGYETFRLLDAWLRQVFVPALPARVRIILSSRVEPAMGWLTAPGWSGLFRSVRLGKLPEREALRLLSQQGIEGISARRIVRLTHGCGLALTMAVAAAKERPGAILDDVAISRLNEAIAARYLEADGDPLTRQAVQAASTVRRMTLPLLAAMMPDADAEEAWERLRTQAFVEQDRDGLTFHDVVKSAIAYVFRGAEPGRYREYRRAAWRQLRDEARAIGAGELWRYTADLIFLLENPAIREAFFPVEAVQLTVEPARSEDGDAIRAIAERQHSPAATASLRWWNRAPETFVVVREAGGAVVGFCSSFASDTLPVETMREDPILRGWLSHLRRHPLPGKGRALFVLYDHGNAPAPVDGALWLDLKRLYLEMRPLLRRVYVVQRAPNTHELALRDLGFRRLPDLDVAHDAVSFETMMLDMGPGSVDGWLAKLVAAELGVSDDDGILDAGARELVIDGKRVGLTRLEFELVQYLSSRAGRAVSRADLLADVWGVEYSGGSNVVDVVVRGVRRKMGSHADMLESVRGTGYRLRVA